MTVSIGPETLGTSIPSRRRNTESRAERCVIARSHAMSRQDHKKRVLTQRVDESAQAAVDGLVYVKQRVFTEKAHGMQSGIVDVSGRGRPRTDALRNGLR